MGQKVQHAEIYEENHLIYLSNIFDSIHYVA